MSTFLKIKVFPKLSQRQKSCLSYIAWYVLKFKDYPTQKEISDALSLSSNSAWSYTEALLKKGYITKTKDIGVRNIRLTELVDGVLKNQDIDQWEKKKD